MKTFSTFWTNTVWYVILGITAAVQIAIALYKSDNRGQITAFFITVFGITLAVETPLLIFMHAYTYSPLIFTKTGNPFDDVLAGNLFSQLAITASLLFVTVLKLKPYWYFIFAAAYGLVEELFLGLGIYSHIWYRTWITVLMLPPAFVLIKLMYMKFRQGFRPLFYYGYILFALFPINIAIHFPLMLTRIQDLNYHVLADPMMSRHFIVLVLFFVLSVSLMWAYFADLKWHLKTIVFATLEILYYFAYKMDLINIKEGWFLPVSLLTVFIMYCSIALLDRLYGHPLNRHNLFASHRN